MSWIGVITNAGAAVLADWSAGGTQLVIDKATVGSGTHELVNLRAATALAHEEAEASIISASGGTDGTKFKIQIGPAATDAYTAHEIGIWGHLYSYMTQESQDPVLIAIHQDSEGTAVPTAAEMPDFAFALFVRHAISNTEDLEVTIDPDAYVSESTFESEIEVIDSRTAQIEREYLKGTNTLEPAAEPYEFTIDPDFWDSDTATITENIADPDGGNLAICMGCDRGGVDSLLEYNSVDLAPFYYDVPYTLSIWVKASEACTVKLLVGNGTYTITATPEWKLHTFHGVRSSSREGLVAIQVPSSSADDGSVDVYLYDMRLVVSHVAPVAFSGSYRDLSNKPSLAAVATSGDYDDLDNKPDMSFYKIVNTNFVNISYSGASVPAGNSVTLTGTFTVDSGTTSVRAIPAECNIGWFNSPWSSGRVNVEISGTTGTITASVRNATGSAITSATARVFIIQLAR